MSADVVAASPRVMEKLGLGYETQELNPNLIFASASGFGPDGPMEPTWARYDRTIFVGTSVDH